MATAERIVYESPGDGYIRLRLVRIDVTDPRLSARRPYQLLRGGHFRNEVYLEDFTLDHLQRLRDDLTRELALMGRS